MPGGGIRAITFMGATKALEENGYQVENLIGYSGGGVVAAAISRGIPLEKLRQYINRSQILLHISHKKLESLFHNIFGDINLEDLPQKVFIQATDVEKEQVITFTKGKLYQVLTASCNQMLSKPVKLQGCHLVDGGVGGGTGCNILRASGAKNIIVMHPGPPAYRTNILEKFFNPLQKYISITTQSLIALDNLAHPPEYFIDNLANNYGALNYSSNKKLYQLGYDKTLKLMGEIKQKIPSL
jgi:NTE family protein